MCDMLSDIREDHVEIELEKYGTIIAAPTANVYLLCCALCQDMFRQMEGFVEHIKQEHVKSNTNNSLSFPKEVAAAEQKDGPTTAQQIIASKLIKLPYEEEKYAIDIPTSSLQRNEVNIEKSLEDQEQAFNEQNNTLVNEEGMERVISFEISTIKEEPAEEFAVNQESVVVESIVKQKQFELEDCGVTSFKAKEPETLSKKNANALNNGKGNMEKELPPRVCKRSAAIISDLPKKSKRSKICKCCNKSFSSYSDLKKHIDNERVELAIFNCDKCDYTALTRSRLEQHMGCHSAIKPYKCTYCHYAAKRLYDLRRHARIHTGVREFSCDICQKTFITFSNLKYHMDSHYLKHINKKSKPSS